jgi:hypothetical protein
VSSHKHQHLEYLYTRHVDGYQRLPFRGSTAGIFELTTQDIPHTALKIIHLHIQSFKNLYWPNSRHQQNPPQAHPNWQPLSMNSSTNSSTSSMVSLPRYLASVCLSPWVYFLIDGCWLSACSRWYDSTVGWAGGFLGWSTGECRSGEVVICFFFFLFVKNRCSSAVRSDLSIDQMSWALCVSKSEYRWATIYTYWNNNQV